MSDPQHLTISRITAYVGTNDDILIDKSSVEITILTLSPYHYLYVLDASERTAGEINGNKWLDVAKNTLKDQLNKWVLESSNVGLRVFGYTEVISEYCENTELLVGIEPRSSNEIISKLEIITPQRESPLREAIVQGIDDLTPGCDDTCTLVLLTNGPDTCTGEDWPTIRKKIDESILEGRIVELQVIAIPPTENDELKLIELRDQMREIIPNTFYYSANDFQDIQLILDHIIILGAPDLIYRSNGYLGLSNILKEQGDFFGSELLHERSMELITDPVNTLYERSRIWGTSAHWGEANLDLAVLMETTTENKELYYFLRGVTWYNLGQYELSVNDFAFASRLNPDFALAEFARGLSLAPIDQPGIQEAFNNAFIINPNLFATPFFEMIPPEYQTQSFYETAYQSELVTAGRDFFSTPLIFIYSDFLIRP